MARIAGVNIPDDKRVIISLTYIMGIGKSLSQKIIADLNISEDIRVKDISSDQLNAIRDTIETKYLVEGELRRKVIGNIKRLKDIRCYRGTRHANHMPCRGQHTRYNARTTRRVRGKRLAVGGTSMKKIKAMASEKT
jgi:small subunit ribosomal protein S13